MARPRREEVPPTVSQVSPEGSFPRNLTRAPEWSPVRPQPVRPPARRARSRARSWAAPAMPPRRAARSRAVMDGTGRTASTPWHRTRRHRGRPPGRRGSGSGMTAACANTSRPEHSGPAIVTREALARGGRGCPVARQDADPMLLAHENRPQDVVDAPVEDHDVPARGRSCDRSPGRRMPQTTPRGTCRVRAGRERSP